MNIILCGFMGCGKSTVAGELKRLTGWIALDTDLNVVEKAGISIPEIFRQKGEEAFRELEYEVCCQIATGDRQIVATGGGALTFARNAEALRKNGLIVLLDVPFAEIRKRVVLDGSRPLFRDPAEAERLYNKRMPLYKQAAQVRVDASVPAEKVAATILEIVKKRENGNLSL